MSKSVETSQRYGHAVASAGSLKQARWGHSAYVLSGHVGGAIGAPVTMARLLALHLGQAGLVTVHLIALQAGLAGLLGGIFGAIVILGGGAWAMHRWFTKSGMQADINRFAAERRRERERRRQLKSGE